MARLADPPCSTDILEALSNVPIGLIIEWSDSSLFWPSVALQVSS